MTELFAHQIACKAAGGEVFITNVRDPADGSATYAVTYTFGGGGDTWLSRHRFQSVDQADAGAIVLADFLGAEYRK